MSTTVDTLLKLPIIQSYGHLLTNVGLNNIVQYITVMEAPDFHFSNLGANVFILTTLSAHHHSLSEINRVIRGLCEAHVSAIGIKLGRFVDEIDASTIQIARRYDVPLITLERSVYFREVLSDMLSIITGNQRHILNQINSVNQALIDAILQNRTPQNLLDLLCNQINCYCCCLDRSCNKIAESSSLKTEFDTNHIREAIDDFFKKFHKQSNSYLQDGNTIIFPCIVQEQLLAAFCIVVQEADPDLIFPLAQSIVSGICIKFLEQNLKTQAERELVSSILDDVLFSRKSNAKVIAERLDLLNFTTHKNNLVVILSRIDSNHQEYNYFYMMENLQKIFAGKFDSVIVFKRKNEYIALISHDSEEITNNLKHILSFCENTISNIDGNQFDIGCSMTVSDLALLSECYLQSKKALQFGRMIDSAEHIYLYDNYFEFGLISCGIGSSDANTLFQRIIVPVQEYDRQFKTELWDTLETGFKHDKLEHIANNLHIHISTLRYRLQKIETLTGYSYFASRDRLTLHLAYLLFKISNITPA